jgi:hypothetical protein
MIAKSAALPNPPELKVRGSNPLGHAISNHTICNDFGAVSRVNARSVESSWKVSIRPFGCVWGRALAGFFRSEARRTRGRGCQEGEGPLGGAGVLGVSNVARVNVEESAFVMARRLAFHMGWDEDLALGKLTRFWHDSQAEEVAECGESDIAIWFKVPPEEAGKLVAALLDAKALAGAGGNSYRIRGNSSHIERLKTRREAASKGGKRSWESRVGEANGEANATADAQLPGEPRTEQSRAEQSISAPLAACLDQWGKTLLHWKIPKNPKTDEYAIAQLIKQLGTETVMMALAGFRGEKKSADFDPAQHLSFERIRDRRKRDRLVNLGAKVLADDEARKAAPSAPSGYSEKSWEEALGGTP